MTDVVAGHVPVMTVVASAAIPQIKAGHLRALGVTTPARHASIARPYRRSMKQASRDSK